MSSNSIRDSICVDNSCSRCILQHEITGISCFEIKEKDALRYKSMDYSLPQCIKEAEEAYPTCCMCDHYPCDRVKALDHAKAIRKN